MGEVTTLDGPSAEQRWILLAIAHDALTAEQWQDALDNHEIESELRIEDSAVAGRSSAMPHTNAAIGHELFAYSLWVPTTDRQRATEALSAAGWDGNYSQRDKSISSGIALRGALFTLAAAGALIMLLILLGIART